MPRRAQAASRDANPVPHARSPAFSWLDDDRTVHGVVVRLLPRRGSDTLEVPEAEIALLLLGPETGQVHQVVTDDRMPG